MVAGGLWWCGGGLVVDWGGGVLLGVWMAALYRSIVLLGAPGVGKGTQGELLGGLPGFRHVSSGDMFRGLDASSELGKQIRAIMATGELVPDELTVRLWSDHMRRLVEAKRFDPSRDLLVLDGIPRNPAQAGMMASQIDVLAVVYLDAKDRDALVQRLKGRAEKLGRADDAREDVIRNRFAVYDRETAPLVQAYPAGLIHTIEPMGWPLEVLGRVLTALAPVHGRVNGFSA